MELLFVKNAIVLQKIMEENKRIFDETDMCGACATGESATYIDEL